MFIETIVSLFTGNPQVIRNKTPQIGDIVRNIHTDKVGGVDEILDDGSLYILGYEDGSGFGDIWETQNVIIVDESIVERRFMNIPPNTLLYKLAYES